MRACRNRPAGRRVSRATLTGQLEDALRLDILEGVLQPGQRLLSLDLTERYGVSATPLREALQRLAADNLVEYDPRLGTKVAPISKVDLRDIYDIRILLETIALKESMARRDANWIAHVSDAWAQLQALPLPRRDAVSRDSALAWSTAHRRFHEALFESCGSAWLLRFVSILYDHSERYRMLSAWSPTRERTSKEHEAIYRFAVQGSLEEAPEALRDHLERTVSDLEKRLSVDPEDFAGSPT